MSYFISRIVIVAGTAALASLAACVAAPAGQDPNADQTVAGLLEQSSAGHGALMRGDVEGYRKFITLTDDFTFMSPFGGTPSRGADMTEGAWEQMKAFFRNGTLKAELVQAYSSADLVVLAIVERNHGEVGGLPAQDWPLRVTLVFRREGKEWRLAHRHADPLVQGVTLGQAAALARGLDGNGGFDE
jgi:ketosteroid isomerase-like protein